MTDVGDVVTSTLTLVLSGRARIFDAARFGKRGCRDKSY